MISLTTIVYGFIIFVFIAWILQAWDVYQAKIISPIGSFFENRGQLVWIAFACWLLIYLHFSGKLQLDDKNRFYQYLQPQSIKENFIDDNDNVEETPTEEEIGIDSECGCPTAFPREQRFSDGRTFTIGIKGSYAYPLPISCGVPVGKCSKPIPTEFPPDLKIWNTPQSGLIPTPPPPPKPPADPPLPPTYRDIHGIGPRSFWCAENKKCVRHIEDPLRPWKNTCGSSTWLAQVPPPVFHTKEECEKGTDPCANLNLNDCIQVQRCGWCQDRSGQGKCVMGTPEGPDDLTLSCTPNLLQKSGAWIPGYPNPYILQSMTPNNESYSPEAQPETWKEEQQIKLTDNISGWDTMRNQMTVFGL